jgi:two-component system chemotaxis response regulator CheY
MPNLTGVDFVRKARSMHDTDNFFAPMVMVTSEKTMAKIEEALDEAGAEAFITKPFTAQELAHKLKKVVEKAQQNRLRREREEKQLQQAKPAGGFWNKLVG